MLVPIPFFTYFPILFLQFQKNKFNISDGQQALSYTQWRQTSPWLLGLLSQFHISRDGRRPIQLVPFFIIIHFVALFLWWRLDVLCVIMKLMKNGNFIFVPRQQCCWGSRRRPLRKQSIKVRSRSREAHSNVWDAMLAATWVSASAPKAVLGRWNGTATTALHHCQPAADNNVRPETNAQPSVNFLPNYRKKVS